MTTAPRPTPEPAASAMPPLLADVRDDLIKLSKLGNGEFPGNSVGNVLAQAALRKLDAALQSAALPEGWVAAPVAPDQNMATAFWKAWNGEHDTRMIDVWQAALRAASGNAVPQGDIGMVCPSAPERIWLQVDPEPEEEGKPVAPADPHQDDVTWCVDKINASDTLYIRADLSASPQVATPAPQPSLDEEKEREAFEAHYEGKQDTNRAPTGAYLFAETQLMWLGWLARASLLQR